MKASELLLQPKWEGTDEEWCVHQKHRGEVWSLFIALRQWEDLASGRNGPAETGRPLDLSKTFVTVSEIARLFKESQDYAERLLRWMELIGLVTSTDGVHWYMVGDLQ